MATIFLFRHGQTLANKKKIFTGWSESELTKEGIKECEQIREQLKDEKVTKAYVSDQKRAQQTLYIVLGDKKYKIPIIVDSRIRERSYGDLTGKSKVETEKKFPKEYPLWHRSYDVAPPHGESIKDVEKRVLPFVEDLIKHLKKNDVVFISAHANSLRPIRRFFEKMSTEEMCTFEHPLAKVYKYEI